MSFVFPSGARHVGEDGHATGVACTPARLGFGNAIEQNQVFA